MKRKILSFLFAVCLVLLTTACAGTQTPQESGTATSGGVSTSGDNASGTGGEDATSASESATNPSGNTEQTTLPSAESTPPSTDSEQNPPAEDKTNILVVYFSATGTTKTPAEYVASGLGADIYEILPVQPYSAADLNYHNDDSRSSKEMNDPTARPAISGSVADMAQYDVVFIGYPIWWGEAPRIVSTFMESYDFSGKTIIPFCTSSSSNIGSSGSNLAKLTTGATWLPGRRFGSGTSRSTIIDWVNSLGLAVVAQ